MISSSVYVLNVTTNCKRTDWLVTHTMMQLLQYAKLAVMLNFDHMLIIEITNRQVNNPQMLKTTC